MQMAHKLTWYKQMEYTMMVDILVRCSPMEYICLWYMLKVRKNLILSFHRHTCHKCNYKILLHTWLVYTLISCKLISYSNLSGNIHACSKRFNNMI